MIHSQLVTRELWRRGMLIEHVLIFGESACPIGGCFVCRWHRLDLIG